DKEKRNIAEPDSPWASRWEKRSAGRGKPNQVFGWAGGDAGSTLNPPAYQKLAGPWVNGKDPAS
ncbi:MAG TPA: gfo/Idh/MocA family oxidoreductase, partial [Gemmataceae bacterium]|nr:gfo/Idh/MocA family oxidoreductase [Gemmataceae bacterium]